MLILRLGASNFYAAKPVVSKREQCNGKELANFFHLQDHVNVLRLVPKDFEKSPPITTLEWYLPNCACTTFAKEKRGGD